MAVMTFFLGFLNVCVSICCCKEGILSDFVFAIYLVMMFLYIHRELDPVLFSPFFKKIVI